MERIGDIEIGIKADTSDFENKMKNVSSIGQSFGRQMTKAFSGVAFEGRKIGDVMKNLALQLSQVVLKSAFKPLENAIGSGVSGLFGNIAGVLSGGAVQQRGVTPFAGGGVINSPINFPLGGRGVGLAGESGPEAIIPLSRGSDGRLGVRSQGATAPQIIFNVTATDAASFGRSQSQISAMLYRAVSQGQRNL